MDVLDAYILAACVQHFDLKDSDLDAEPRRNAPLTESFITTDWILHQSREILQHFGKGQSLCQASEILKTTDEELLLAEFKERTGYVCLCGRKYKLTSNLRKHLTEIHDWVFEQEQIKTEDTWPAVAAAFMQCGLLLRDTYDAYRHEDGDRAFLNAKVEMLLGFYYENLAVDHKSCDILNELYKNMFDQTGAWASGQNRPTVDKAVDIKLMMKEIVQADVFNFRSERKVTGFEQFKHPIDRINPSTLKTWFCSKKIRAKNEMIDVA
ncbi:uncharacterized protein LOC141905827 [Tubulanus polymorphus]|uniref:uncharacterized protein LOC141905827 n=1 Tax=Tubulanus polymorphus TaxID=672921 RepID=UPI003DA21567